MASRVKRHAYKEIQLKQLRGFCETARLGSLVAAAESLGLTQPTVWEQVHALERGLGAKLIEPHGRGCQLTEDGKALVRLVAPLVAEVDSLPRQFNQVRSQVETWLTIATTQRVLVEDLPDPIAELERSLPHIRYRFLETRGELTVSLVESRQADLGLTIAGPPHPPHPWLHFEPAYEIEPILVAPKNHPLAKKRVIKPRDLIHYPLINSLQDAFDPAIRSAMEKMGIFRDAKPCRMQSSSTSVVRRYVEKDYGIGLVVGIPAKKPTTLHERSLGRYFGSMAIYLVCRKGHLPPEWIHAIVAALGRNKV